QHIIGLGFDITYGSYTNPPDFPYTIIIAQNDNDLKADNKNYGKIRGYQLEYYNDKRVTADEELIENKFDELGISYQKVGPIPIEDGTMLETIYEFQLI
ncbi:MAG: hypothetical protein K9L56_15550, partial [Clostridiales bacterium]|nr:hypothetical protein [Clostridiales bacterium]